MLRIGPHQTLEIRESTPEVLDMLARWEPGGSPPIAHLHPGQDEHFEVLEGTLTVTVDGERREVAAGETLDVPRGAVHAMWNEWDAPVSASWRVTPALRTEEMFRTMASGGVEDFLERYSAEFRLAPPG